jgi:transposase
MKVPTKFIETLSKTEKSKLIRDHQTSKNFRIRNRSHAILLSYEGFAVDEIAKICRVDRDTVSLWINNWNEVGSQGLEDGERSGRPTILTVKEQEKAVEIAMQNPRFPHRQLGHIKLETGKAISKYTLKNLIKKKTISGKESS